jgi:hypothetical protein
MKKTAVATAAAAVAVAVAVAVATPLKEVERDEVKRCHRQR